MILLTKLFVCLETVVSGGLLVDNALTHEETGNRPVPVREEYLSRLIGRYEKFAADSQDRFISEDLTPHGMDEHFKGEVWEAGYWWCRHRPPKSLPGNGVFCLANVVVPERIRGQGVFGKFLDHIMNNPHHFAGVEVESLDRDDRLIEYLKGRGFVETDVNFWGSPTVRYMFERG